jgi:putative phosphoribosyl transferase
MAVGAPRRLPVDIRAGDATLPGDLVLPSQARGVVAFAHGSGSSRHSPRNRFVAGVLEEAGLATLLFDLLTPAEEHDRVNVFDIAMLGARLGDAIGWLDSTAETHDLAIGLFGASTGAAAAVLAAAAPDSPVRAVVSRGGRPDLAPDALSAVRAPTLLIVGSRDEPVLTWNREAAQRLTCEHRVEVVEGATHLFEEPGTLEAVASLARNWFTHHLGPDPHLIMP